MMIRWMIYLGLLIFAAYESVVFEDAAVTMFFVAGIATFCTVIAVVVDTATDVESLHENPCSGGREE